MSPYSSSSSSSFLPPNPYPSMKDDIQQEYKRPKPTMIVVEYSGKQQNMIRPPTLKQLRNLVVWTFSLPRKTPSEHIQCRYTVDGQVFTIHSEEAWSSVGRRNSVSLFVLEIAKPAPAADPSSDHSGFEKLSKGTSNRPFSNSNVLNNQGASDSGYADPWNESSDQSAEIGIGNHADFETSATPFAAAAAAAAAADPWGDEEGTQAGDKAIGQATSGSRETAGRGHQDPWETNGEGEDEVKASIDALLTELASAVQKGEEAASRVQNIDGDLWNTDVDKDEAVKRVFSVPVQSPLTNVATTLPSPSAIRETKMEVDPWDAATEVGGNASEAVRNNGEQSGVSATTAAIETVGGTKVNIDVDVDVWGNPVSADSQPVKLTEAEDPWGSSSGVDGPSGGGGGSSVSNTAQTHTKPDSSSTDDGWGSSAFTGGGGGGGIRGDRPTFNRAFSPSSTSSEWRGGRGGGGGGGYQGRGRGRESGRGGRGGGYTGNSYDRAASGRGSWGGDSSGRSTYSPRDGEGGWGGGAGQGPARGYGRESSTGFESASRGGGGWRGGRGRERGGGGGGARRVGTGSGTGYGYGYGREQPYERPAPYNLRGGGGGGHRQSSSGTGERGRGASASSSSGSGWDSETFASAEPVISNTTTANNFIGSSSFSSSSTNGQNALGATTMHPARVAFLAGGSDAAAASSGNSYTWSPLDTRSLFVPENQVHARSRVAWEEGVGAAVTGTGTGPITGTNPWGDATTASVPASGSSASAAAELEKTAIAAASNDPWD